MESQEENYQPGVDQNQGIVGEMARNEQAGTLDPATVGVSQEPHLDPNTVTNADATNDDVLNENAVENEDLTIEGTDEEQASFDGPDF